MKTQKKEEQKRKQQNSKYKDISLFFNSQEREYFYERKRDEGYDSKTLSEFLEYLLDNCRVIRTDFLLPTVDSLEALNQTALCIKEKTGDMLKKMVDENKFSKEEMDDVYDKLADLNKGMRILHGLYMDFFTCFVHANKYNI